MVDRLVLADLATMANGGNIMVDFKDGVPTLDDG